MLTRALAACAVVLLLAAGCGEVTGEPVAESPAPSPQPTPATLTPEGPGRQPPLPQASDVEVRIAFDTITEVTDAATGEAAAYAERALASWGWDVARVGDSVVATRSGPQAMTPGAEHEVVTASLDSPADLGVLLTVAHALRSRSSVLPLVLVAQGATSYDAQLTSAERDGQLPVEVSVPSGASRDDLEALAVDLVTSL